MFMSIYIVNIILNLFMSTVMSFINQTTLTIRTSCTLLENTLIHKPCITCAHCIFIVKLFFRFEIIWELFDFKHATFYFTKYCLHWFNENLGQKENKSTRFWLLIKSLIRTEVKHSGYLYKASQPMDNYNLKKQHIFIIDMYK